MFRGDKRLWILVDVYQHHTLVVPDFFRLQERKKKKYQREWTRHLVWNPKINWSIFGLFPFGILKKTFINISMELLRKAKAKKKNIPPFFYGPLGLLRLLKIPAHRMKIKRLNDPLKDHFDIE